MHKNFEFIKISLKDKKLLTSLMKCHDTELCEGAKNDIGVRVMYMFNFARATQNEQRVEDHAWVSFVNFVMNCNEFLRCWTISESSGSH